MEELQSSIKTRVPQTVCYKCDNEEIDEVCHHCGRAMCKLHVQKNIPWWIGGSHFEFVGLGMKHHPAGEEGKHCEECLHFHLKPSFWIVSVAILATVVVALLLTKLNLQLTFSIFLIAIFGTVVGGLIGALFVTIRNEKKKVVFQPLFPILGKLLHVIIKENINGVISLDREGSYHSSFRPRFEPGEIEVKLKLNSLDRDRLQKYKRKYNIDKSNPLFWNAGFVLLHGRPNIKFQKYNVPVELSKPYTILLNENVQESPFLLGQNSSSITEWKKSISYVFRQIPKESAEILPIQIFPRVVRQGNGWSLELIVQVTPKMNIRGLLDSKMVIKNLKLYFSPMWGAPESVSETLVYTESSEDFPNAMLEWKDIPIPYSQRAKIVKKLGEIDKVEQEKEPKDWPEEFARRKSLIVRFERSILPSLINEPLTGNIQVRIDHSFSGITSTSCYYPTGENLHPEKVRKEIFTNVEIDFHLDLNSLCFQEPYTHSLELISSDIPPDYVMIKRLSNKLAEDGVYVQRVIENEPRTNRANAKIINRYWRLEGRKYIAVYPIDFHIVITGREHYVDRDEPESGKTDFEIKLFALIFNEDMRQEVIKFGKQVEIIVKHILPKD